MAAAEGLVAEFSSFANFEEKKRKPNLLMAFPKTGNQMGSFGQNSRYFRIYALNKPFPSSLMPLFKNEYKCEP